MNKAYEKQVWKNYPDESTPLNAENLQKVSDALDTVDSRVVSLDESKAEKDEIPTVPTKLSDLSDDSTHRTVTDADKTNWNGKLTNTIDDKNFYNKLQWRDNSFVSSLQNEFKYSDGIDKLNSYAGSVGSALNDFNDYIGSSYASLDENGCVVDSQLPDIVLHDDENLKDKLGNVILPVTSTKNVLNDDGKNVDDILDEQNKSLSEQGLLNRFDGQISQGANSKTIRSTNKFAVNVGDKGYVKINTTRNDVVWTQVFFYGSDDTAISSKMEEGIKEVYFDVPENTKTVRFVMNCTGDITPSEITNAMLYINRDVDKINSNLSSLEFNGWTIPDGMPLKDASKVDRVDLATLPFVYNDYYKAWSCNLPKAKASTKNCYSDKYTYINSIEPTNPANTFTITSSQNVWVTTVNSTTNPSGYLYYELAEAKTLVDGNEAISKINDSLYDLAYGEVAGGKNLFDKTKYIKDYRVSSSDGTLTIYAGIGCSEYINIKGKTKLTITKCITSNDSGHLCAFYNASKTFISGVSANANSQRTIDVPSNAEYIVFNFSVSNIDLVMLEVGNTATDYEPYIPSVKMLAEETANINSNLADYGLDNKFDGELLQGLYYVSNGKYANVETYVCSKNKYSCKTGDYITLKLDKQFQYLYVLFYKTDGTYLGYETAENTKELNTKIVANADYFYFNIGGDIITPQTVGHVGVYVNNAIDKLEADLSALIKTLKDKGVID